MNSNYDYSRCVIETGNIITEETFLCFIKDYHEERTVFFQAARQFLMILCSALVFFMQAGFAMLCAGSVRLKNVRNSMLKNMLDAAGTALGFFFFGYAFAFGDNDDESNPNNTFIGNASFASIDAADYSYWLFNFAFASASVTIVAGALAERCQMAAYLCYSIVLSGLVYPFVVHSIWSTHGFLSCFSAKPLWNCGAIDFAGSAVVHITGGSTALYATMILGPRQGRFHDMAGAKLEKPNPMPGHSVALQVLGTLILWCGWFGFNAGNALSLPDSSQHIASLCAVTTTISGAAGGVTALVSNLILMERTTGEATFDIVKLMNGALTGLVAITSGCAVVDPWASCLIGAFAGLVYLCSSQLLLKLCIDDAVDAIPVHLAGGIWGMIATGLFAKPEFVDVVYGSSASHFGWFYAPDDGTLLGNQLIAILFVGATTFFSMFPFFIALNYFGWFRADSIAELVGLDVSYHGGLSRNEVDATGEPQNITQKIRERSFARQRQQQQRRHEQRRQRIPRQPLPVTTEAVPLSRPKRDLQPLIVFHEEVSTASSSQQQSSGSTTAQEDVEHNLSLFQNEGYEPWESRTRQ